nr:SAM and SH3 domain-containing protein [Tanacetum cinerariifolium]
MEYMIRSFHKRGIQISHLFNIISTGANNLQHKWNQTKFTQTNTTETLNKFIFGFWDVYAKLLNHCSSSDNMQQKWNDINKQFKLTDNMQHKWNEFNEQHKLADKIQQKWTQVNQQYKVTDNIGDIFKHFLTNVKNIIEHVLHSLNNMFPPETRNEQICYLFKVAAVIVLSIGSVICIILLWSVTSVVKVSVYPLTAGFRFVTVILRCVRQCLWFGGKVGVKMMKAPGKPTVMIARAVFEANPKQYFANLRGKV